MYALTTSVPVPSSPLHLINRASAGNRTMVGTPHVVTSVWRMMARTTVTISAMGQAAAQRAWDKIGQRLLRNFPNFVFDLHFQKFISTS
jgi:hypothetical protein